MNCEFETMVSPKTGSHHVGHCNLDRVDSGRQIGGHDEGNAIVRGSLSNGLVIPSVSGVSRSPKTGVNFARNGARRLAVSRTAVDADEVDSFDYDAFSRAHIGTRRQVVSSGSFRHSFLLNHNRAAAHRLPRWKHSAAGVLRAK